MWETHPSCRLRSSAYVGKSSDTDGKSKRVERIPEEWVEQIRPLVEQGRNFKDAIAEVFAANAQLLALRRKQSTKKRRKKK